jgi:hypothetical protein
MAPGTPGLTILPAARHLPSVVNENFLTEKLRTETSSIGAKSIFLASIFLSGFSQGREQL